MTLPQVIPAVPPTHIVDENLHDSVQVHRKVNEGRLRFTIQQRGPLLSAWGTRERERELRLYWHHDYNDMFRGAIAALIKRIQSTPWEIKSPRNDGAEWQRILQQADFGDWDRFISKLVTDYSRHDQGGFFELIAPGDPWDAPAGPVSGIAVLDSVRCYPTGDPVYPVIYYDINNAMHYLHRGRVVQILDNPDSAEDTPGYGDCALARSIASVKREILMGRYVEMSLDDEPPPGIAVFGNIGDEQVDAALQSMRADRLKDTPGEWGKLLRLFGLRAEEKPTVDFISYTHPPEKFDYELYSNLDARRMALAIGIDVQDIWGELSSAGLGTGRQSEVMSQKARGKGLGRLLKTLERKINLALPEDVEFSWKYEDPQEDMEQAQILQTTATSTQLLATTLNQTEQRQLLANTVPAIHDVLTDETGNVRRLGDVDQTAATEEVRPDIYARTPPEAPAARFAIPETTAPAVQAVARKDFSATATAFASDFAATAGGSAGTSAALLRSLLRDQLWNSGMQAYEDGLRDAGAEPAGADAEELARRRRVVATWNASQTVYIDGFVDDVLRAGLTADQIVQRADLWVAKSLRAIYYAGMVDAESALVFPWLLGPTEKHCATCLANSGQRHTMKEWSDAGMYPGSSSLACGGYQCACEFGDGITGKSIGSIPGAAPSSLIDRLTSWLHGIFRR